MTQELTILNWVESSEQFSVDFDQLWQFCGFARKDSAKRTLESNFVQGTDYISYRENLKRDIGSCPIERILLTESAKNLFILKYKKSIDIRDYGVYLVWLPETIFYKIGITKDINNRFKSGDFPIYPKVLYYKIITNATKVERELHRYYKDSNTRCEWFRLEGDKETVLKNFENNISKLINNN